jgi:hypothetical protein
MNLSYPKSAIVGLIIAGFCLGVGGTAAAIFFGVLAWTQWNFLVSWLPVVFIAIFLAITMVLLQRDANARRRGGDTDS